MHKKMRFICSAFFIGAGAAACGSGYPFRNYFAAGDEAGAEPFFAG